jgi:mannose-1-phosphate guanylyltransferase/phosphomannomutase
MKKAVIMAGGFGTRLRPLTMSIPKPMVPLMNMPMMEHIVHLLKKHNITDIVSLLYYQPEHIISHFGDGSRFGITMNYVQAAADYGTAGSVRNAAEHLKERFIIISGDVLTDFDLSAALQFHESKGAKATILLTRVPNPLQYGIVMTDPEGNITRFLEKPSWGEVFSDTINTGIYILEPEVMELIPYQREFDFSKDLYPLMLRNGMKLCGYIADGYWRDIGNLNEYQIACEDILKGKAQVSLQGDRHGDAFIGTDSQIAANATLEGCVVVGNNTTIGDHASLRSTVIGNNVTIGAGARISGCVIWDNVIIGEGTTLTDDVICNDTVIGGDSTISENVFIAEACLIGRQAQLMPNIKLWPRKQVEAGAILSRSLVQEEKWLRELFTDSRITGLSNIEINPEFAAKLGAAIGNALGAGTMVVASRDADLVSRMTQRAIVAGLMSAGIGVNDLQITPIPQARQELRNGKSAAGFHVRRSIRQPDTTDIILFNGDGRDLPTSKAKTIERYFFGEDIRRVPFDKVGNIIFPERSTEAYAARFTDALNVDAICMQSYKLLIDYSNGLASAVFPSILGRLSANVVAVNSYMDITRAFSDTRTDVEARETASIIKALGYELGFKIDASAEKIAVVDDQGEWYPPLRLLTLVTKLFLEANKHREPYTIAVPVLASSEIEDIVRDYNVNVIRIKNNHSAMMEATQNKDVLFVGDTRGRFIFTEYLFASDGMFSLAKVLEMLALTGHRLSEFNASLPRRYQRQISVPCKWEKKGTVMRKAMEYSEGKDRVLIDGVKIFENDSAIVLLPDRERAAFFVFAESSTPEKAERLAQHYARYVEEWAL